MAEQHLDLSGIKNSLLQLFDSSILNRLGETVSIRFKIQVPYLYFVQVVDRHRVDADPDPTFHFEAEPDPDQRSGSYSKLCTCQKSLIFNLQQCLLTVFYFSRQLHSSH